MQTPRTELLNKRQSFIQSQQKSRNAAESKVHKYKQHKRHAGDDNSNSERITDLAAKGRGKTEALSQGSGEQVGKQQIKGNKIK